MDRLKKTLKKLFVLPPLPTIFISIPAYALVIYTLASNRRDFLAYFSYAASAYALVISITGFMPVVKMIKSGFQRITAKPKEIIMDTAFGRRFLKDELSRAEMFLYPSLLINLLYVILKVFSGLKYRSSWFISIAAYYVFLALMRFLLLRHANKNSVGKNYPSELKRYRMCGIILLVMTQALIAIVILIVTENRSYVYPGRLIYAMAAYSVYAMTVAIINILKYRKHGSPVISASKAINLVAALVSILSLETAMLTQFGNPGDIAFRRIMTGLTGGFVCIAVLAMAFYMIIASSKKLKAIAANSAHK